MAEFTYLLFMGVGALVQWYITPTVPEFNLPAEYKSPIGTKDCIEKVNGECDKLIEIPRRLITEDSYRSWDAYTVGLRTYAVECELSTKDK